MVDRRLLSVFPDRVRRGATRVYSAEEVTSAGVACVLGADEYLVEVTKDAAWLLMDWVGDTGLLNRRLR